MPSESVDRWIQKPAVTGAALAPASGDLGDRPKPQTRPGSPEGKRAPQHLVNVEQADPEAEKSTPGHALRDAPFAFLFCLKAVCILTVHISFII